jgi:hypothetical protein
VPPLAFSAGSATGPTNAPVGGHGLQYPIVLCDLATISANSSATLITLFRERRAGREHRDCCPGGGRNVSM